MRIVVIENKYMTSSKYQSPIDNASAFMAKVEELVREIVIQNSIPYYRIESGMETYADVSGNNYVPVVRIITYFENSVGPISAILQQEFDVEIEQAGDNKNITVDSFASKRITYNAALKANRLELTEYKRYGAKYFKICVCSMLQDAWAGIEKELGYNSGSLPDDARRDFYRVGALLEMADLEFLKLRNLLNKKENSTASTVYNQPETVNVQKQAAQQPENIAAPVPTAEPVVHQQTVFEHIVPQRPVFDVAGIAPQRVAVGHNIAETPLDTNNKPVVSLSPSSIRQTNGAGHDKIQEPQAPVQQVSMSTPPPVAERQADPVKFNFETSDRLNVNANGIVEKALPMREQPQTAKPVNEEKQRAGQPPLDEYAQMTDASLREYVLNSRLLREVDSQIAANAGAKLNNDIDIEGDVERLRFLKVFSLRQLHEKIADNKADIIAFAEKWIGRDNGGSFDMGISLFYLEYLLVAKKNDPGFAVEYVLKFISDNEYSARYIVPTYNSIRETETSSSSRFSHLTLK